MNDDSVLNANAMRTRAIFERKIGLAPKEMNKVSKNMSVDNLLIEKIRGELESKCSQHGWVIPGTVKILSRSMCQNEPGRFTGSMVSWVQVEGEVYYPTDRMLVIGEVLKKNKMGMFVVYENAVQIIVPRDLHLGHEEYDAVEIGQYVEVELKKSRFQVNDQYISSVGIFKKVVEKPINAAAAVATATVLPPVASASAAAAAAPAEERAQTPPIQEDEEAIATAAAAAQPPAAAAAAAAAAAPPPVEGPAEDEEQGFGATIGDFL